MNQYDIPVEDAPAADPVETWAEFIERCSQREAEEALL